MVEIRVQLLEENNFNNGKLFKLCQGWKLRLQHANSIVHRKVRVYCNLPPLAAQAKFVRTKYYELEWCQLTSIRHDDFNKYIDIECHMPGSFNYYFTYEDTSNSAQMGGSNFLIEPELKLSNGHRVDLNSLQIHTVLSKLMGPLNEWKTRLQVSHECNYNMIHFTPVQDLCDESRSGYCISDHLSLLKRTSVDGKFGFDDLNVLIETIYREWNMFSICDLVYNHMSNRAPFIRKCPQATYNLHNSPHLIPAFVLDRIFQQTTIDISNGLYETSHGISRHQLEEHNLEALRNILRHQQIPKHKLEEFFKCDIQRVLEQVKQAGQRALEDIVKSKNSNEINFNGEKNESLWRQLNLIPTTWQRNTHTLNMTLVGDILVEELKQFKNNANESTNLMQRIYERFERVLNSKNESIRQQIEVFLNEAVENVLSNVRYHFFAHDGPRWRQVTKQTPLARCYFYYEAPEVNEKLSKLQGNFENLVTLDEKCAYDQKTAERIHAHNGWVMGDDPLRNFASPESQVYFRRHLIVWGDSAKLRYGNSPADSPQLWSYMKEYTMQTARIFHGVRLDNCHSTPIHVAQYFLDEARTIRPDLFVIAELFTNSECVDNKFITELGINSLIREAMSAYNSNDLGRLVHRFGGEPAGSFAQPPHKPLLEGIANAIIYDVTHDNPSLIKSHSVYDVLPTSCLVLMSGCATASTRGFDELVPHAIDVVHEERLYSMWSAGSTKILNGVNLQTGILKAKQTMNKLHYDMGEQGFTQIYVDQFDAETTVVTRHNPSTHENIILIARTAFSHPHPHHTQKNLHRPLAIPSKIQAVMFEASLNVNSKVCTEEFKENDEFINGLVNYELKLQENVTKSDFIDRIDYDGNVSLVHFKYFPPGTVMAFKVTLNETSLNSLQIVKEHLKSFSASKQETNEIEHILSDLSYDELNIILFRSGREELSENINSNTYDVPHCGPLTYCGLQGIMNVLEKQRLTNNLGHPLFENLRDGDWLMTYTADRLDKYYQIHKEKRANLHALSSWLKRAFDAISKLPRYLIPKYFDLLITLLYTRTLERCWKLMSTETALANEKLTHFKLTNASSFLRWLALGGVALSGHLSDCPMPNTLIDNETEQNEVVLSMSAGLPHFSVSYMRSWGRDTFISLKGLFLLTNRKRDARNLILSYGSCLRHGLIPNLLCEGRGARYNARDAVWWWLKAIADYCQIYDTDILSQSLYRLYPTDDSPYPNDYDLSHKSTGPNKQKLFDVMQEALSTHVNGLKFRERHAGPSIDEHMSEEGFNIEIGVDLNTGFVFGGNAYNCGTWCDKMGSSAKAGTRGEPATPRDGSAVELVGLTRFVLEFLTKCTKYPYKGVRLDKEKREFTWREWAEKIDANFEKHFWIDENSCESTHINKRSIYKDTLGSTLKWADYQMRPNFLLALCLAPQMVNKDHARLALAQVKRFLMNEPNSLGIKTLDESDMSYCGVYDNANDSSDKRVAHGFNYHQGPEWLWPVGYYLRSLLLYSTNTTSEKEEAISVVKQHLGKLSACLYANEWKSLPELTNKNGEECTFSCSSQAWSLATIIEVFYDLADIVVD